MLAFLRLLMRALGGGVLSAFVRALLALTVLVTPPAVLANALTPFAVIGNTDFKVFAIGQLRGSGNGSLVVSGITGPVRHALMYWHGPVESTDPAANASVMVDGIAVTGANIGISSANSWPGFVASHAYRADVSAHVRAKGNGTYALSMFRKPGVAEINGVQLIVFYSDGITANNRDVALFDGNDSTEEYAGPPYDGPGWHGVLEGIKYSTGAAYLTLGVSDGQNYGSSDGILSAGSFSTGVTFNGAALGVTGVQIGNGQSWSGALWDLARYDVTSALTNQTTGLPYALTGSVNDSLSLVFAALDVQSGTLVNPNAADDPHAVPLEPMSIMIVAGLALWFARKKKSHKIN